MAKADDWPAFPLVTHEMPNGAGIEWGSSGMSLRDYFAGQALAGLAARGCWNGEDAAEKAYEMADAMLATRKKETSK